MITSTVEDRLKRIEKHLGRIADALDDMNKRQKAFDKVSKKEEDRLPEEVTLYSLEQSDE